MYKVALPISKSIANRILLLQAIHGDPLMRVSADMPDDVLVLHDTLEQLQTFKQGAAQTPNKGAAPNSKQAPLVLNLKNCGTALRFLQVHLEKCYPGAPVTLTGDPRLMERDGKPTTQTTSARILHGEDIPVAKNGSPYITMSRRMAERYPNVSLETDWSSAAFWYEYIAIHGGELLLEGLKEESLQGDRVVADIYVKHFSVKTEFVPEGAVIVNNTNPKSFVHCTSLNRTLEIDFVNIPDLYPPIALTCERLGITLHATGTDRLRFKESDRLEAVRLHEVRNDHRMAMALLAADFLVPKGHGYFLIRNQDSASVPDFYDGNDLQKIIAKSYPRFVEFLGQITTVERRSNDGQTTVKANVTTPTITHITPRKGINDDHLGKKHALSKLIHAATSEYVWLHDDDVILPKAINVQGNNVQCTKDRIQSINADLIILPLRMESGNAKPSLLEKLQIEEYAAIQELTMRTAKRGHAVMCSGANLIVRREAWLACEPDLHPEIPSGDDMFLLEAMKKRGMQIAVIDEPDYTAVVRPASTWRAFFRQRMRWAGKAPKYTDPDILRCGALVVTANILQLLCPFVLLVKFPIEYGLIRRRQMREQTTINCQLSIVNFLVALLLELLYPFYMFASLLGGFFRQRKW
ncbi:MAG: glycosyltransferase [Paludibacteraceae bacterium]|nr:glycosyltransferase [Paludibacteraceae bacterium]